MCYFTNPPIPSLPIHFIFVPKRIGSLHLTRMNKQGVFDDMVGAVLMLGLCTSFFGVLPLAPSALIIINLILILSLVPSVTVAVSPPL